MGPEQKGKQFQSWQIETKQSAGLFLTGSSHNPKQSKTHFLTKAPAAFLFQILFVSITVCYAQPFVVAVAVFFSHYDHNMVILDTSSLTSWTQQTTKGPSMVKAQGNSCLATSGGIAPASQQMGCSRVDNWPLDQCGHSGGSQAIEGATVWQPV